MSVNMSTDIEYLSATELSAGFAAGSHFPVTATAAVLAAIDARDGALNAFRLVDAEAPRAHQGRRRTALRLVARALSVSLRDCVHLSRRNPTRAERQVSGLFFGNRLNAGRQNQNLVADH